MPTLSAPPINSSHISFARFKSPSSTLRVLRPGVVWLPSGVASSMQSKNSWMLAKWNRVPNRCVIWSRLVKESGLLTDWVPSNLVTQRYFVRAMTFFARSATRRRTKSSHRYSE